MGIVLKVPADPLQVLPTFVGEFLMRAFPAKSPDDHGHFALEDAQDALLGEAQRGLAVLLVKQMRRRPEISAGMEQIQDFDDRDTGKMCMESIPERFLTVHDESQGPVAVGIALTHLLGQPPKDFLIGGLRGIGRIAQQRGPYPFEQGLGP